MNYFKNLAKSVKKAMLTVLIGSLLWLFGCLFLLGVTWLEACLFVSDAILKRNDAQSFMKTIDGLGAKLNEFAGK